MAHQLMTICVLCLLCALHAQCSGPLEDSSTDVKMAAFKKLNYAFPHKPFCPSCRRYRRDLQTTDNDLKARGTNAEMNSSQLKSDKGETVVQLHRIFTEFGDPERMTINFKEFTRLVHSGRLLSSLATVQPKIAEVNVSENHSQITNNSSTTSKKLGVDGIKILHGDSATSWQCLQPREFLGRYGVENGVVNPSTLLQMCPALLARSLATMVQERQEGCLMVPQTAYLVPEPIEENISEGTSIKVWLCATGSIIVVSLCGLLGVGIIPFMQRMFYQQLLQFLVALAVGTLCGDALLHLLPHAILGPEEHGHSHVHLEKDFEDHSQHTAAVWRGFVACLGLIFFFVTEKCLTMMAEWYKKRQRRSHPAGGHSHRVKVMRDIGVPVRKGIRDGGCAVNGDTNGETEQGDMGTDGVLARSGKQCKHKYSSYPYCYGEISDGTDIHTTEETDGLTAASRLTSDTVSCCVEEIKLPGAGDSVEAPDIPADFHPSECESYTVIIREHETSHHGHSHAHGHVHAAPQSMSSVAWMVIMGDGLHNLTDGVAIGAAFAAGLPGGFSTALAVLCHELPHELGDFAVLLKAGMPLKQAVFYNVLSSILCLMGMLFGVALGHTPTATPWVFGAAAGMFLYIALVDMIPELSSNHSQEGGSVCQCILQVLGMLSGTGVMLLIALYEHDLKSVFSDGSESH